MNCYMYFKAKNLKWQQLLRVDQTLQVGSSQTLDISSCVWSVSSPITVHFMNDQCWLHCLLHHIYILTLLTSWIIWILFSQLSVEFLFCQLLTIALKCNSIMLSIAFEAWSKENCPILQQNNFFASQNPISHYSLSIDDPETLIKMRKNDGVFFWIDAI